MFAAFLCDGACTRAKEGLFGAGWNKNLKVLINILIIITQSLSWSTDKGGCPTRVAQSSSLVTKCDQNQEDRPGASPMKWNWWLPLLRVSHIGTWTRPCTSLFRLLWVCFLGLYSISKVDGLVFSTTDIWEPTLGEAGRMVSLNVLKN